VYERLQRFVLRTFELTFLELIYLGLPVSLATLLLSLAGYRPPTWPIMLIVFIGIVWAWSYVMMSALKGVWTIPIQSSGPDPFRLVKP
jgi:hypothetical protein